ncbi:MAG: patatin-like phospholipase family protein [Leptospiraceae bacterium]
MPRRKQKSQQQFGQISRTLPPARGKKRRVLIVEGGGMKGAFAGGVLAAMNQFYPSRRFDLVVGVSAGSCSAAYYVTESPNDLEATLKNLNVWRWELSDGRFIARRRIFGQKKTLMDQTYLIDHLFGNRYRLKMERLDSPKSTPLYVVVSNLSTGKPEYVRATSENALPLLKAATALPIATKGRSSLGNELYTDGAVTDPIPVEAVIKAGYTDITVVLNYPRSYITGRTGRFLSFLSFPYNRSMARFVRHEYHLQYNRAKEIINHPPPGVKVHIVDPPMSLPMKIVTTNEQVLNQVVDMGLEAGRKAFEKMQVKKRRFRRWLSGLFGKR